MGWVGLVVGREFLFSVGWVGSWVWSGRFAKKNRCRVYNYMYVTLCWPNDVHGNGIPRGNGIPVGFPWEWEWKTHIHGNGSGNGNDFRGSGNVEKYMDQKFPFAIRFIILFMYFNFWNALEIKAFDLLPWYSLHLIVEQQLASALFTVRFMTARQWKTFRLRWLDLVY